MLVLLLTADFADVSRWPDAYVVKIDFFITDMQRLNFNQKFACNVNVHTALHSGPDCRSKS